MRNLLATSIALLAVAACTAPAPPPAPSPPPEPGLPFLGGYRDPADQCRRVGEAPETVQFLDHTRDLVGCPADYEGRGVFVTETGAAEVGTLEGYVLYSVPL